MRIGTLNLCILSFFAQTASTGFPGIDGNVNSPGIQEQLTKEATVYFQKFGYFTKPLDVDNLQPRQREMEETIKKFQSLFLIYPSGLIDVPTVSKMSEYRCINKDFVYELTKKQIWTRRNITWSVSTRSLRVPLEKFRETVANAFESWRLAVDFTFREIMDETAADIVIKFQKFPESFINIIAGASQPWKSEISIDENRYWKLTENSGDVGLSLYNVLVHEIGHSLGLSHSFHRSSVMYPIFKPLPISSKSQQVPNVDRLTIRKLYYGELNVVDDNHIDVLKDKQSRCPQSIDSVVAIDDNDWLVFRDDEVWSVRDKRFSGVSKNIQTVFPKGPQFVNATALSDGLVLLFVERTIFGYEFDDGGFRQAQGYPKELHGRVIFYPQGAFSLNNGSVVLLSGNVYAMYDVARNAPSILNDKSRVYPNLPNDLRSGIAKEQNVDTFYWMFDDTTVSDYDMITKSVNRVDKISNFLKCQ